MATTTAAAAAFAATAAKAALSSCRSSSVCFGVAGRRRRSGVVRCDASLDTAQATAKAAGTAALEQFKISANLAELWEALKHATAASTGPSSAAIFAAAAAAAAAVLYKVVSGLLAPPPPPPRAREEPEPERLPPPVQLGEVSEEELRQYDGSDPKKPLLMAIKGQIYDVSQSRMFYGPGGPYALFAGKDASRALAKMSLEPQDLTGDISGLGPFELGALQDWEYNFTSKYEKVGSVKKTVPVEEGNVSTCSETQEKAVEVELKEETAPRTEDKLRDLSSEETKEK